MQVFFFVKLMRQLGLANQFSSLGLLCKFSFQRGGHVAARELICINLHPLDNVLYRGTTLWKVLYETAPTRQGFIPMVQLPPKFIVKFRLSFSKTRNFNIPNYPTRIFGYTRTPSLLREMMLSQLDELVQ
jgi:hypothetical protein